MKLINNWKCPRWNCFFKPNFTTINDITKHQKKHLKEDETKQLQKHMENFVI